MKKPAFLLIQKPGFSLIELLVVISIIGILAAVLLVNFAGVRQRGNDAYIKGNMKQLQTALRMYYNDANAYPKSTEPTQALVTVLPKYFEGESLGQLLAVSNFEYVSDGEVYKVCVDLENTGDREIADSQSRCVNLDDNSDLPDVDALAVEAGSNYCVCAR